MTSPIRLAYHPDYPADRLSALSTRISTGPEFSDAVDIVEIGIGEGVPQGSLFAYLFRRFGYPNSGWDDHKELARYMLTTARPDMLMSIVPYAGGTSSISFRFFVPREIEARIRAWETRSRDADEAARLAWIEETGRVLDWMPEALAQMQEAGHFTFRRPGHSPVAALISSLHFLKWKLDREGRTDLRVSWLNRVTEEWEACWNAAS